MEQTIPRLVQSAAKRFGDRMAIEEGDLHLSYRELAAAAVEACRALLAAGLEPGDRVGIWAPNIWEWVIAAIGAQSAGGVVVTLNTRLKGAEAGYILRKSGARVLFTTGDFLGMNYAEAIADEDLPQLERIVLLRGESPGLPSWSEFLKSGSTVPESDARARLNSVRPEDLSDIIFTSGTTGQPKGAMTAHGQNIQVFAVWSDVVGLREGDRYLIVNAFFHSFGYKAGWLACIMKGATILPDAVFDAGNVMQRVSRDRINVLPGPPTLYQSMLMHPDLPKHDLSNLRLAVTGAAPTPVELIHRMRDELGFETIVTAYGLTESCGMVSICRQGDDPERVATTSGCAIPDTEVICVGEDGAEVTRGEEGEIWVRGYNVMQGYFDDAGATAEAIDADGWLHTGDIGVMDEDGYLRITDRIKDMYIVGGFNCYPAEIEKMLFDSGFVAAVAVIGVPDDRMGEVGKAFIVPAPGHDLTPESVRAWCRDNMANYKVPRSVELVEELPTNAMGKVMKFVLRDSAKAQDNPS